jgi:hypothetical protein
MEDVLAYAVVQPKYQPSFQQADRVTAMTGAAAMEIGGVNSFGIPLHARQNLCCCRMIDSHKETRLNIIDEVSFAGYHSLG